MSAYKIVRDTIGPHVGQWIVEDGDGRIVEGPFDTKRDAEAYLVSRENWRQFYAGE
jgi:hypothetical protein